MGEFKFPGMQQVALKALALPVERISRDRMTQMLQVDTDLMGAAGARHAGDQGPTLPAGEEFVVGHRITPRGRASGGHFLPLDGVASDRQIDHPLGMAGSASDNRKIGFLHQAVGKGS
jgi:hypothetical protein